jgi:acid stress-induced BolA-like protein IbaG/YrbA
MRGPYPGLRYKPLMSDHPTSFQGDIPTAIREHVTRALPDAIVEVTGGGGHWTLVVTSAGFADKSTLARHRLVMSAIAPLLAGNEPPIHAVDSLTTKLP